MQAELRFRMPEDHKCQSCVLYTKRNKSHGKCGLFDKETCPDASCSKYRYYKENRKL